MDLLLWLFTIISSTTFLVLYFLTNASKRKRTKIDGRIVISVQENGKKTFSLEFDGDPYEDLEKKEYVTFKIVEAETLVGD